MAGFSAWGQIVAFALVALAAAGVILSSRRAGGSLAWFLAGGVLIGTPLLGMLRWSSLAADHSSHAVLISEIPALDLPGQSFVRSDSCRACHPSEYASWHHSYHRTMTQAASPDAIIPDLHGLVLSSRGRDYRFERDGDEFFVTMADPDWEHDLFSRGISPDSVSAPPMVRTRIVMTTGSHNQQTFWVASNKGRKLLNVPWMYLTAEKKWAPREDVFLRPPQGHRKFDRWNDNCIECHSTAGEINFDKSTGHFDTAAAELGIACEACHGPGEAHIRANQDPRRRLQLAREGKGDPTIVNPARLDAQRSSYVCGQCHGMNVFKNEVTAAGVRYRAGGDLTEGRMILRTTPARLTENDKKDWARLEKHLRDMPANFVPDRFWPDGMVRVSGRDHNAMVESLCFAGGDLSCLSCHSMHSAHRVDQLKHAKSPDEDCLQCHSEFRADIPAHTHHAAGSPGSACVSCHMPHTVYGLLKTIRSHHIDSPTAEKALRTGRPDSCTICHVDRTMEWTAAKLNEWYGQPMPELNEEQKSISAGVLWLLTGDANQRAIVADAMGRRETQLAAGTEWLPGLLAPLLNDPFPAVRFIAHRSLRTLPGFEQFEFDFVGPADSWAAARDRALAVWNSRRSAGAPLGTSSPGAVLFDSAGQLDRAAVARLLLRRDDRPMDLRE